MQHSRRAPRVVCLDAASHLLLGAPPSGLCVGCPRRQELPFRELELPPKDRTCSGLRFRADELAWRLI
ncbi:hypothetical protein GOE08_30830, partial [Sinorhizobium medicae]|nr:hypothetical protein [Sinorhizobium medicae]